MIIASRGYIIIHGPNGEQATVPRSDWNASLQRDEDVQAARALVSIQASILRERERQRIAREAKHRGGL